jgi:hypothetical protein
MIGCQNFLKRNAPWVGRLGLG